MKEEEKTLFTKVLILKYLERSISNIIFLKVHFPGNLLIFYDSIGVIVGDISVLRSIPTLGYLSPDHSLQFFLSPAVIMI